MEERDGWGGHVPVMLEEVLELLEPAGESLFLDGTVGGGGHAQALLARCPSCALVGIDRDWEALDEASRVLEAFGPRVRLVEAVFDQAVEAAGIVADTLAGALLDLGVSSHQLDRDERGFAFRVGLALDMRMDPAGDGPTAADMLNESSEEELARVFWEYGEAPRSRRLAREIAKRRKRKRLETSDDLVGALGVILDRPPGMKDKARIFQALRIAVNDELGALKRALPTLRDALRPGGVFVIIAYHSLEDRIVKQAFRSWSEGVDVQPGFGSPDLARAPLGRVLTRKPLRPTEDEVRANPRARSARLRGWRKAA